MSGHVIGMDGGGTKTKILVADMDQHILDEFLDGPINYNGAIKREIDQNLLHIFHMLEEKGYSKDNCKGICIGAAGISNPYVAQYMKEMINGYGYTCPYSIVGDHETALVGALLQKEGMIIIAGTGSICYGRDAYGNTYRTGGFGYLIDDEGSGYAIGRDILSTVVRAYDKREKDTVLTELVYRHLNIHSMEELIGYVYDPSHSKKDISCLSILIKEAYALQDQAASRIIEKCVNGLVDLTGPILSHMNEDCSLAVSGSVLLQNQIILNKFKAKMKQIFPKVSIIKPKSDAAYGAIMLATDLSKDIKN